MKKPYFIKLPDEQCVAYFTDSGRFFKVNKTGKSLIEDISTGTDYNKLVSEYEITKEKLLSYLNAIESVSTPSNEQHTEQDWDRYKGTKHLERLVIHVANDCNLRCIYCYAKGGGYGGVRNLISFQMLHTTLDRFFHYFDSIDGLQIFGGEPLLNMSAIRYICKYIEEREIKTGKKTQLSIVTNGILIKEELIELIKRNNIQVTISYDGDIKTNDQLRLFPDHSGTSKCILSNARQLYEATGQPKTIEVTYTQLHVDNQVGVLDIVRNIKELFPKTSIHLVPVSGEKGTPYALENYDMFPNSIDEIFSVEDKKNAPTYSLAERIFAGMANPNPNNRFICSAGVGTLSVSVEGDVYPCFMFTNEEALCLGNVRDEHLFESEKFLKGLEKLREFSDKTNNPECRDCFIRTLCNGCLGMNASHDGNEFQMNKEICEMFRRMTERAIIQYVNNNLMVEKENEPQKT